MNHVFILFWLLQQCSWGYIDVGMQESCAWSYVNWGVAIVA